MGIFYKDLAIKIVFKDELIDEAFDGIITNQKLIIRVRDFTQGHSGNNTKHKYSPSIKLYDYPKGSSNSNTGDPVGFKFKDGKLTIYDSKSNFRNSKERIYVENFIKHNCLNLCNYWYAPDNIKDQVKLEKYQKEIEDRILANINIYDYKKEVGVIDSEILY